MLTNFLTLDVKNCHAPRYQQGSNQEATVALQRRLFCTHECYSLSFCEADNLRNGRIHPFRLLQPFQNQKSSLIVKLFSVRSPPQRSPKPIIMNPDLM